MSFDLGPNTYPCLDDAYGAVLGAILDHGQPVAPRGMRTKELRAACFAIGDADANIVTSPARGLNYHFSVAEWLWILLGRDDVASIAHYNKAIAAFSDDGVRFFGAYGPRLAPQLPWVVSKLRADPDTRHGITTIWQPTPPPTKDVPCTLSLSFLLRDGRLEATGHMRSNDAMLGLPYDVFTFTRIQAYVAALVGVPVGRYTHFVDSLHLYEKDFEKAAKIRYAGTNPLARRSPALTPLPFGFHEAFEAVSTRATADLYPAWIDGCGEPWSTYLGVLLHRSVKDRALLRAPYDKLITLKE